MIIINSGSKSNVNNPTLNHCHAEPLVCKGNKHEGNSMEGKFQDLTKECRGFNYTYFSSLQEWQRRKRFWVYLPHPVHPAVEVMKLNSSSPEEQEKTKQHLDHQLGTADSEWC